MSIIDPILTGIIVTSVIAAFVLRRAAPARIGIVLGLLYVGLGFSQHARAEEAQRQLAASRGHEIEHGRVMPTLGNVINWRSAYAFEGRLYADAVRAPLLGTVRVKRGESIARIRVEDLPAGGSDPARVRRVFTVFDEFATGLTAVTARRGDGAIVVGDMRYSLDTAGFDPLWGILIDPDDPGHPVRAVGPAPGRREGAIGQMWEELLRGEGFVELAVSHEP